MVSQKPAIAPAEAAGGVLPDLRDRVPADFDALNAKIAGLMGKSRKPFEVPKPEGLLTFIPFVRRRQEAALAHMFRDRNPVETPLVELRTWKGLEGEESLQAYRSALRGMDEGLWPGFTDVLVTLLRKYREDPCFNNNAETEFKTVMGCADYESAAVRFRQSMGLLGGNHAPLKKLVKAGALRSSVEWDEFNRSLESVAPELRGVYTGNVLAALVKASFGDFGKDKGRKPDEGHFIRTAGAFQSAAGTVPSAEGRMLLADKAIPRMIENNIVLSVGELESAGRSFSMISSAGYAAYIPVYGEVVTGAFKAGDYKFSGEGEFSYAADRFAKYLNAVGASKDSLQKELVTGLCEWAHSHKGGLADDRVWDGMYAAVAKERSRLDAEASGGGVDTASKIADFVGWRLRGDDGRVGGRRL